MITRTNFAKMDGPGRKKCIFKTFCITHLAEAKPSPRQPRTFASYTVMLSVKGLLKSGLRRLKTVSEVWRVPFASVDNYSLITII